MSAPHLPPYTRDLIAPDAFRSLPWMLFLVGISALTSVAIALATVVWLSPGAIPDDLVVRIGERRARQEAVAELDPATVNDVRRRVWLIKDIRQRIDGEFYPSGADQYSLVLFSSDGWAVTHVPGYQSGLERFWEAVDYQGQRREIERVAHDPVSRLTYVKLSGEGFVFASFADWEEIASDSGLWLSDRERGWRGLTLNEPASIGQVRRHRISEPQWQYLLPAEAGPGEIVIDEHGSLAGFVDEKNRLIESWWVENQYVSILARGKTRYQSVPWLGQMADGFATETDDRIARRVRGFYVSASPTRATSSTVGAGDVVTHIQNKPVDSVALARQILFAPERFSVTVWREGEEVDIMVNKKLEIGN